MYARKLYVMASTSSKVEETTSTGIVGENAALRNLMGQTSPLAPCTSKRHDDHYRMSMIGGNCVSPIRCLESQCGAGEPSSRNRRLDLGSMSERRKQGPGNLVLA